MAELRRGQRVPIAVEGGTGTAGECEILEELGRGGQGIVYKVRYNGELYALKWYFGEKLSRPDLFYQNLENNILNGAPTDAFLWPLEITQKINGSFGYLMKLRPGNYKSFTAFLKPNKSGVRFAGFGAIINAALCISDGFRKLHNRGYSYQDLNDGNFFVDPQTGDVLICDNDNVAPYSENLGILGKSRYMAPEVVTGKKLPDNHTDRFSLAVVLYLMLFMNHPLEGQHSLQPCMTEALEREIYGTNPVFVWDPVNNSNRPVRGVHTNEILLWPLYPAFVRNVFTRAFDHEALVGRDITQRVLEKEWLETFISLRDVTVRCSCGDETFLDLSQPVCKCVNCGRSIPRPPVLKVKKKQLAIAPGMKLYECHTRYDSEDFRKVTGEVVASPSRPDIMGLRNDSGVSWQIELPDGRSMEWPDGKSAAMMRGMKINFGRGNVGEVI